MRFKENEINKEKIPLFDGSSLFLILRRLFYQKRWFMRGREEGETFFFFYTFIISKLKSKSVCLKGINSFEKVRDRKAIYRRIKLKRRIFMQFRSFYYIGFKKIRHKIGGLYEPY